VSVAAVDLSNDVRSAAPAGGPAVELAPRTRALLQGPITPTLLRLAWPNVLVMLAQAATGLIETWFVAKLGTDALAGMALVFPGLMLTQMISAGAMGGGISSAIARALGAGRREEADALVLHAILINVALGLAFTFVMLAFGRPIYRALGGAGGELEAALAYSNVVFAGNVLLWLLNALASVIRGTGNMLVPAAVICVGVVVLLPLSPLLIFGLGPFPALGIAGGGVAVVAFYATGTVVLAWYILSGRNIARLRRSRLRWKLFRDILGVGAAAAVTSLQTNVIIALATALAAFTAGAAAAAGYGTGARLEYLLVPLVFGLGAPLVAMVGTNIGAGESRRALRVALVGGAIAFAVTETIGVAAAIWPRAWLALFSADPQVIEAGASYLRIVGPTYGFFGLALALYFASQGAGRLFWPLSAGFLRMLVAIGGGWLALRLTGSLHWLFAALALGLLLHGLTLLAAIGAGAWFRGSARAAHRHRPPEPLRFPLVLAQSVPSTRCAPLPLVGRGWGWGVVRLMYRRCQTRHPPPQPSPTRGEGADRACHSR
jgi:putative MATE family efflux protein